MSFGLLVALNECDIAVGKDVFLLSTSVSPSSSFRYHSSITTVNLKIKDLAEQALLLSLNIVLRRAAPDTVITLQPDITYRNSLPMLNNN